MRERLIVSEAQHTAVGAAVRAGDRAPAAALLAQDTNQSEDGIRNIMLRILSCTYSDRV